jgi:hypothetical protein
MVDIGLRVLTRPDATALPEVYRRLGMDYDDKASEATSGGRTAGDWCRAIK